MVLLMFRCKSVYICELHLSYIDELLSGQAYLFINIRIYIYILKSRYRLYCH